MDKKNIIVSDLKKYNADTAVIISHFNRYWFTDFLSSAGFLVINENSSFFLVDYRYYEAAKIKITDAEVLPFHNLEDLKNLLTRINAKRLMVEEEYITLEELTMLWRLGYETIGTTSRKWRVIKTDNEIESLKKSASIAAQTIEWAKKQNLIGKTEIEVAKMLSIHMLELGATSNSFDLIVATGLNGAIPHHQPDDTILEEGNLVTLDIGCMYNNYASDITRTFALGSKLKNPELEKLYNVVLKANTDGILTVKAGIKGSDVDKVARNYISSFKEYKDYFTHATGHGVGLEVHELPYVSLRSDNILPLNSVCTVEPGIYIPGVGGARIEDTVVVSEDKAIILTEEATKDLYIK